MIKIVLVAMGLLLILVTIRLAAPVGKTGPAAQGPTAGVVTFRDQAGLTVRVQRQLEAMRLFEAGMGNRSQILADNDALKTDYASIESHQRQAGVDDAGIAGLRGAIRWADFCAADETLRRSADQ